MKEHPRSNPRGVAWAALAVGIFAFIFLAGKLTGNQASAWQIVWLRYVGGLATVGVWWLLSRAGSAALRTHQPQVHGLRAIMGGLGGAGAMYAAANMPVVSATAIGLSSGVFTVALGVLILGERLSVQQYAAAAVCLIGSLIVVIGKGAVDGFEPGLALPAMVALGGAVAGAFESLLIKRLARSEGMLVVLFYVNLFATLIFALPALLDWRSVSLAHLAFFLSLGPIAIFGQSCNIRALRHTDASIFGPVHYLRIVFGMVFGVTLFGETISNGALIGAALVLMGGLWLALSRRG